MAKFSSLQTQCAMEVIKTAANIVGYEVYDHGDTEYNIKVAGCTTKTKS